MKDGAGNQTTRGFSVVLAPPSGGGGSPSSGSSPSGGGSSSSGGNPPSPPALTMGSARSYTAYMVNQRLHRRPQLSVKCTQGDAWTLRCALGWRVGSYSYTAAGRFWNFIGSDGSAYWSYDFTGARKWRTCVKQRKHRTRCTVHMQRFHWH